MPRYHFNIRQKSELVLDKEGEELPDATSAEFEARMAAREIICEALKAGEAIDGREIEVIDESGTVIHRLKVRDVLD
jgi:hypothetical protein